MNRDNHNKSCLRNYLLILVLLACARGEAWGAPDRQGFQEMRMATMATANGLLYYNINGIPYEAERRKAVTHDLSRLRALSAEVGDVALVEHVTRLCEAVIELDQLPQSTANVRSVWPAYTRWLPGLVEAHFGLDKLLSERYAAAPEEDHVQGAVQGLSHDVGRMLLSYQMASFPNFGGDLWILNDQALRDQQPSGSGAEELTARLSLRAPTPTRSFRSQGAERGGAVFGENDARTR